MGTWERSFITLDVSDNLENTARGHKAVVEIPAY